MRVYIMGIDGYIGWALAQYLRSRGHVVGGCDNGLKREIARETGAHSVIPVGAFNKRCDELDSEHIQLYDAGDFDMLLYCLKDFQPDVVVNLAQIPSAPYSQKGHREAELTQINNIRTTLSIHWAMKTLQVPVVQLGTMGEYGTPNIDIPEGSFELEYRGRKDVCQFPRKPGSLYHCSKVQSSINCEFVCRAWGFSITDVMQGVVYGTRAPGVESPTSFWVDECWGTALNRFCAQAVIGHPLTVYGNGSQTRGYLPLRDSLQCLELLCENPPKPGEYRVVNQLDVLYSVMDLAKAVVEVCKDLSLSLPAIRSYPNPRVEAEDHYYNPDAQKLRDLGFRPYGDLRGEIKTMIEDLLPHKDQIEGLSHLLPPVTRW